MRELVLGGTVAAREDVRVCCLQLVVDLDALADVILHSCLLEISGGYVWLTSSRDNECVDRHVKGLRVLLKLDVDSGEWLPGLLVGRGLEINAFVFDQFVEDDAIFGHTLHHHLTGIGLFLPENGFAPEEHVHFGAEPCKSLCELATNRAGADYSDLRRELGKVEDLQVGVDPLFRFGHLRQARNRGQVRRSSCRDDGPVEFQGLPVHLNGVLRGELAVPEEDVNPELSESLSAIVVSNGGPQATQPFHHGPEVDLGLSRGDSVFLGLLEHVSDLGGLKDRLRRDTPDVETVTPQQFRLDKSHLCAYTRRARSGDEPSGTPTDDDDVVLIITLRVLPLERVHILQELGVPFVKWRDF
mmetsp:Transcript_22863/g.45947  ORF Transcript_22863/g.45947 Transcript_22863/m.45947 type:complete len:357 (+) Transcript_22863:640-1710(+)